MNLWNDVRYGLRKLRKAPSFSLIAIVTLAVGIGVTSAIYSICDAMLWKSAALPDLETLVIVVERGPGGDSERLNLTPADFEDIRNSSTTLENIASWRAELANIIGSDNQPEGVLAALVTANFFDAVRVKPTLGAAFETGADRSGSEPVVILSDRLWKRRFGGDQAIVGKSIRIDGKNSLVVGVMPGSFDFPLGTDVWIPSVLTPAEWSSRKANMLMGIARLRPGYTVEQAASEFDSLSTRLEASYPDTNKNRRFLAQPAHRFFVNNQREQYLLMLLFSVVFVLVIACINVANLQLARTQGYLREVALRITLGASRRRVIAQMITESVLLSLPGVLLGLVIAKASMSLIKGGMPPELVRLVYGWNEIQLDHRVLIFTIVAGLLTGVLTGLAPAWQYSRPNLAGVLNEGGRGGSSGVSRHWMRNLLIAAEITLSVVTLVGAGLMVRGFRAQIDTGARIDPATLLNLRLALPGNKYQEQHQIAGYYHEVLNRIASQPGVRSAAAVTALPYSGHQEGGLFTIEGRVVEPDNKPRSMYQVVSPSYFETVRIPLQEGRLLSESDNQEAPTVALVSERLAKVWWKNESPLGKRIRVGGEDSPNPWLTIVGVVGNMIHSPYDKEPRAALYVPYQQSNKLRMDLVVRTDGDPLVLAPAILGAIREVDREQPITEVRSMETSIYNSAIGLNYMAALMGAFGLLALGLSAIGVYGVMAHLVSAQTREIGIRIALGARRPNVLAWMARRGLLPVVGGLALGLVLAFGFSQLLASVIYGVPPHDITTFVGVPVALLVAAMLAIYIPARRAMNIDPIVALRYE